MYISKNFKLTIVALCVIFIITVILVSNQYNYAFSLTQSEFDTKILKTFNQKNFFERLLNEYKEKYNIKDNVLITNIQIMRNISTADKRWYPSLIGYWGINKKTQTSVYTDFRLISDDQLSEQNYISELSPVKVFDKKIFNDPDNFINLVDKYKENYIDKNNDKVFSSANLLYFSSNNTNDDKIKKLIEDDTASYIRPRKFNKLNYFKYDNGKFLKINKNSIKAKDSRYIITIACSINIENQNEDLSEYNFIIANDI
ncbi:MAG: hypothetical protein ABF289_19195 [Clostridiales bacterium]